MIEQFLKKKNHPCKLLCEDEEIKFSADRFLVNKWLFAKTNEHFRLVQARFAKTNEYFRLVQVRFCSSRAIFYENFKFCV